MEEKKGLLTAFNPDPNRSFVIFSMLIRGLFLIVCIISLFQNSWLHAIVAFGSFLLTLIPVILGKNFKVSLPISYQVILLIFIFCAQFLGELVDYYQKFWWWDILLHTSSGVLLGYVGFLLVYILNVADEVSITMSPIFVAFFSLTFAIFCGAVWEIFEFSMDNFFGLNMQKSGLIDTMWDLIVDTIGALIASISGYIELKRNHSGVSSSISHFLELNPAFKDKIE